MPFLKLAEVVFFEVLKLHAFVRVYIYSYPMLCAVFWGISHHLMDELSPTLSEK